MAEIIGFVKFFDVRVRTNMVNILIGYRAQNAKVSMVHVKKKLLTGTIAFNKILITGTILVQYPLLSLYPLLPSSSQVPVGL